MPDGGDFQQLIEKPRFGLSQLPRCERVLPAEYCSPPRFHRDRWRTVGHLNEWKSGSCEGWLRQIAPYLEQGQAKAQDALRIMGCPADPRGPTYSIPTYGFTWYVGVYSNQNSFNDGIIVDDSKLDVRMNVLIGSIAGGSSNTILIAERPLRPMASEDGGIPPGPATISHRSAEIAVRSVPANMGIARTSRFHAGGTTRTCACTIRCGRIISPA